MSEKEYLSTPASWDIFPPWGFMPQDNLAAAAKTVPPPDWIGGQSSFLKWRNDTLQFIQDSIWPVFDPQSMSWTGKSVPTMKALTIADLDLLRNLYTSSPDPLTLPISAPAGLPPRPTQQALFQDEDVMVPKWGRFFRNYDRSLSDSDVLDLLAIFKAAYLGKVNSILWLKTKLQRPRPWQMAMILGYSDFACYEALSADTPSMVCGHCSQALLALGGVMEDRIRTGTSMTSANWGALQQLAVDIGDRRVLARVHYPSDSIASWIMILKMSEFIFAYPKVKDLLKDAIMTKSIVYKLIQQSGGSIYQPMLDAVARA